MFAAKDLTVGQLNAIVKIIGGHNAVLRFLRGELVVNESSQKWYERRGCVHFTVTSNGWEAEQWVKYFTDSETEYDEDIFDLLRRPYVRFSEKGTLYNIVVLREPMLISSNPQMGWPARFEYAKGKGLLPATVEIACLIRQQFSDEELDAMGLPHIDVMYPPTKAGKHEPFVLDVTSDGCGLEPTFQGYLEHKPDLHHWQGLAFLMPTDQ